MKFSWKNVAYQIDTLARSRALDAGQQTSLRWIGKRIAKHGIILADEMGTGKTRIACALVHAVMAAGGRAAVVVPQGLMHQWALEFKLLAPNSPAAKRLTSLPALVDEIIERNENVADRMPNLGEPEWWIISHSFRAPRVQRNTKPWRLALPALVQMKLAGKGPQKGAWGKWKREVEKSMKRSKRWAVLDTVAASVAKNIKGNKPLRRQLGKMAPGTSAYDVAVTDDLLGAWLGEFDLIVIDEAHRGRGDTDAETAVPTSVLARLVDVILRPAKQSRRLCVTATPMELKVEQWLDLLQRARCGLNAQRSQAVVHRLHDASVRAAVAPDEADRLAELVQASEEFTALLAPCVTRRRRDDDNLIRDFARRANPAEGMAHPHRRIERVEVPWSEIVTPESPWLDVIFAAECMGRSARKARALAPRSMRNTHDAYAKMEAGDVSVDVADDSRKPMLIRDGTRITGALARTAFWHSAMMDAHRRVLATTNVDTPHEADADHPRIVAAVREIERWTSRREKVLVFGVFTRPLRVLRDVLNVRRALRAVDLGLPLAHAIHNDEHLLALALRQWERMADDNAFSAALQGGKPDMDQLVDHLAQARGRLDALRTQINGTTGEFVKAWLEDPTILGGVPLQSEIQKALHDHLTSFVLGQHLEPINPQGNIRLREPADFLAHYIRPMIGEVDESEGETQERDPARIQDNLRVTFLEDIDAHQSSHARLMQSDTRWETRRYLQASFNRRGASPWVLITQSHIGREGLNLHEACRVMVQFHAEWNAVVLEQQVGRVDRKGSLWDELAKEWLQQNAVGPPPFIEIRQLVLDGTYDAMQWERVVDRQRTFDLNLFGPLLSPEDWARVPRDQLQRLIEAAPRFAPTPG